MRDVCCLTERVRGIIADALHAAIGEVMQPSIEHIAPINTIGCYLLKHLTRADYVPVAGSIEVGGGGALSLYAHVENVEAHTYYLWIQRSCSDGDLELVDFGSRYWLDWAVNTQTLWIGGPPPDYIWSPAREIPSSIATYTPNHEVTMLVRRAIDRAIRSPGVEESVTTWETAVNRAIEVIMGSPEGLRFLVDAGIAEPLNQEERAS
jgi:hypothetical protein